MSATSTQQDAAAAAAIDVVREFLAALEARDVAGAQARLADDVQIVVPGGRVVSSASEIVANSQRRYQAIGKHIERMDVIPSAGGRHTLYCSGTLHGAWPDGLAFEAIRFIDRFEVFAGRIRVHEVWNDAAEHRAARAAMAGTHRTNQAPELNLDKDKR
jgi:ketosteroid isomerase-like protein